MRVDNNNDYIKNQCSLVVRVDGKEIEVPVTFGMTAEDIRMVYPFLVSIMNDKIENPIMQFNRGKERGDFADLSEEEYNAELHRVVAQSKYWYEKSEAGLLDIAIRFALDIKLRGISDLESVFSPTQAHRPFKLKPVTEEEAGIIMHRLKLDDAEPAQEMPDAGSIPVADDLSDVETADERAAIIDPGPGDTVYDEDGTSVEDVDAYIPETRQESLDGEPDGKSEQQLDDSELEADVPKSVDMLLDAAFGTSAVPPVIGEESGFEETMRRDMENIDTSRYQSEYKPEALSDDQIKDGMLVRDDSDDKPVSVIEAMSDDFDEEEEPSEEENDEDFDDDDLFDEENFNEASFAGEDE